MSIMSGILAHGRKPHAVLNRETTDGERTEELGDG